MNMFISKLSQVGLWTVKEFQRGRAVSIARTGYLEGPSSRYIQSLRHSFSTTTSDKASEAGNEQKEKISVTFVDKDGEEKHIKVPVGMSMLEAAHENDIELEGACEGSLACSTCHVIVMDVDYYNKLEDPTDEENDMLDLAFGLTETSRLGCQVIAKPELDGMRLALPAATRNFAVDGVENVHQLIAKPFTADVHMGLLGWGTSPTDARLVAIHQKRLLPSLLVWMANGE